MSTMSISNDEVEALGAAARRGAPRLEAAFASRLPVQDLRPAGRQIPVTVKPDRPGTALEMAVARGFEGEEALNAAAGILVSPEAATVTVPVDERAVAVSLVEQALAEALSEISASLSGVRGFVQKHGSAKPWRLKPIAGATWTLAALYVARVDEVLSGVPLDMVFPERLQVAVGVMRGFGRQMALYGSAARAGERAPVFLGDVAEWIGHQRSVLDSATPEAEREAAARAWLGVAA